MGAVSGRCERRIVREPGREERPGQRDDHLAFVLERVAVGPLDVLARDPGIPPEFAGNRRVVVATIQPGSEPLEHPPLGGPGRGIERHANPAPLAGDGCPEPAEQEPELRFEEVREFVEPDEVVRASLVFSGIILVLDGAELDQAIAGQVPPKQIGAVELPVLAEDFLGSLD